MTSISPTFALQAHTLLEGGQPVEAISLCKQGIELYPDYATAYTVLAKAYRLTGDIRAAVDSIERGLQRLPLDRSLLRLHSQMQHPASEQHQPNELPEPEQPEIELPEPEQPEIELPEPEQPEIELPEPEQPEIELPEPEQPEIELPEPEQPEIELPEPEQPEIELPEPEQPEIELPEPEQPEIELPEPEQPEIELPEPEQPEIELPEPEQPEIELPEPEQPAPTKEEQSGTPRLLATGAGDMKIVQTNGNTQQRHGHLRVIESASELSDMPSLIWRSRNVRLIPGLEFTPLRFESKKDKLYRRTYKIPDPPPFPDFPVEKKKAIRLQPDESKGGLTPLEELARRLEAARIPRVEEEETQPVADSPTEPERRPAMVSETIARIYEMQGATQEAIRAYEALARQKPDQAEVYLKKARELKSRD